MVFIDVTESLDPHLHGVSHFGDNIQDEWFLTSLVFKLTREIPGLIARVVDSDGEFMLIEAANHLPEWASPETCEQRVRIIFIFIMFLCSYKIVLLTTKIRKKYVYLLNFVFHIFHCFFIVLLHSSFNFNNSIAMLLILRIFSAFYKSL